MFLGFKKKTDEAMPPADLASELAACESRRDFLLLAARALLQLVREFSLDLQELKTEEFRAGLSELSERLAGGEKLRRLEAAFDSRKRAIAEFAARQKDYLRDREAEFKDIIDILSKAMVALDSENRQYNRSILEQSRRIEDVTLLDDIKKVKQALLTEVETLRESVRRKEARDTAKIEELSRQVSTLNSELKSARTASESDALTGAYNRRSFDRCLAEWVEKNTVKPQTLAMLMLDIDDFKRVNDSYGHQTGDSVLLAVANKCRQTVRAEDFLARYGGEEFVLLMPGASLRNAVKKARQIGEAIAATRYLLEGTGRPQHLSLTVSIGVSGLRKADTAASLIARADKALYLAKTLGKNRVVSENDVPGG
jgi:diguanylate cyclase